MALEDTKIGIKDVITYVGIVAALGLQWGILTTQLSNVEKEIKEVKSDFKEYKKEHYDKIDKIYNELLRR